MRLLLSGILVGLLLPAGAAARSLEITAFESEIAVSEDSSMRVTERIAVTFRGRWNGIVRSLPVQYPTARGLTYHLRLAVETVFDEQGNLLTYETSPREDYRDVKIFIPGAEDATRTVVLVYRVKNGLRFFPEHDELYWNVTGNDEGVPIRRASATVTLPERAAESLRAVAYTGPFGARGREAKVTVEKNVVTVSTTRPLGYKEGLTLAVGWDKGIVREPSWIERISWYVGDNPLLGLPLLVTAVMTLLWYRAGRDPRRTQSVMPLYDPPEGLRPAEVGVLVDYILDSRDVTATLVDLAVRGYLTIEESGEEFAFHLTKAPEEWGEDLKPYERFFLDSLSRFALVRGDEKKKTVWLSDLRNNFYVYLSNLRTQIYAELIQKRYLLRRPDTVRQLYLKVVFFILLAGGMVIELAGLAADRLVSWGILLVSAAVVAAFAWIMPARTRRGADVYAKILGLQEYLTRAEKDRLKLQDPKTFERLLPYAMALGVESNWARAFGSLTTEPPDWYQGGAGWTFTPLRFTDALDRVSSTAATAMASTPRGSASESGFSGGGGGGGFSGGGFGGGGVRGF